MILDELAKGRVASYLRQPSDAAAEAWLARRSQPDPRLVEILLRRLEPMADRVGVPGADDLARRTHAAAVRLGTPHQVARACLCRAKLLVVAADYPAAAELLAVAAALAEQVRDRRLLAAVRLQQGYHAWIRRDIDAAIDHLTAAAALYEQDEPGTELAETWRMLGVARLHRGEPEDGQRLMQQATAIYQRLGDTQEVAHMWIALAIAALELRQVAAAERYRDAAAALIVEHPDSLLEAQLHVIDAGLAMVHDDQQAATTSFAAAAATYGPEFGHSRARVLWMQANADHAQPDGVRLLLEAWRRFAPNGVVRFALEAADTLNAWAARCYYHDRPRAAWLRATHAIKLYDEVRDLQSTVASRAVYRRETVLPTMVAVSAALELAQLDPAEAGRWQRRAWQTSEAHKSGLLRSLVDRSAWREVRLRAAEQDEQTRDLITRLDRVEDELGALYHLADAPPPPPDQPTPGLDGSDAQRLALTVERSELQRLLSQRQQRLGAVRGTVALPTAEVVAVLRQDQAGIVSYSLTVGRSFAALVVRPDGSVTHVPLPATSAGEPLTDEAVEAALLDGGEHRFSTPWADWSRRDQLAFLQLGDVLWRPLAMAGVLDGLQHVYIVPDGALRYLPFAALTWEAPTATGTVRTTVLDQTYTTSVLLTSATLPMLARADGSHVEGSATTPSAQPALILDPAPQSAPAWSRAEEEHLSQLLGGPDHEQAAAELNTLRQGRAVYEHALTVLRDGSPAEAQVAGRVDRTRFVDAVNRAGSVLFLGHGEEGGLVLADGLLTPYDVLTRLDMRGPAVLGACLVGYDHAQNGLAGSSTIHTLHVAGCGVVIGALWRVPPASTARLLALLQADRGQQGGDWAGAVQRATRRLRDEPSPLGSTRLNGQPLLSDDPFAWAPFVCFGHSSGM